MFARKKIYASILLILFLPNCRVNRDDILQKQLFDLNWKFSPGNNKMANETGFNDINWRSIDLPHDWSNDAELSDFSKKTETNTVATETGWYRKHFEIPDNWKGKRIVIDFEGIGGQHKVFVNGVSVKRSENGTLKTQVDLTPTLNQKAINLIAIQVTSQKESGNEWNAESGIFRHVWLVIKESTDFKE